MNIKILPYKQTSSSARSLAIALKAKKLLLPPRDTYRPRKGDVIINWGNTSLWASGLMGIGKYLNNPRIVGIAVNKYKFFNFCEAKKVPCPKWTPDVALVRSWLKEGRTVLARTLLESHSGRGIHVLESVGGAVPKEEDIPHAPLYTLYQPKKTEYRVHVIGGKVVDCQEKRKSSEAEEVDYKVRVHRSGWVFCRENIKPPKKVLELALEVISKLDLDFGAVDIGWTDSKKLALCYEVNTAPGLEGTTLKIYAKALREYIDGK